MYCSGVIVIQTRGIFITLYLYMRSIIFSETVPYIIYIWDSFRQNEPSYKYIKCYKIPLRLNSDNFPTVKAIDILFSTLHTTSFLYCKVHFEVLHLLRASIAMFDTPPGSIPPKLSVGVIKSLQIRFVGREVLYLTICSVR